MADIELVIKLDKELYETLKNPEILSTMYHASRAADAVRSSTPLPAEHDKLIDYGDVVDAIDDWVNAGEYKYTNATDYLRRRIANVPSFIKAEMESD